MQLDFQGNCVTRTWLSAELKRWLGRDTIEPTLRIEVTGYETPRLALWFTVYGNEQPIAERRFSDMNCEDLREAVGLSIALAIDATILDRKAEPQPKPAPVIEAPPPSEPVDVVKTSDTRSTQLAAFGGIQGTNALGPAALGGELELAVEAGERVGWGVRAGVTGVRGASRQLARGNVDLDALGATLKACLMPLGREQSFAFETCAASALLSVHAVGNGYDQSLDNRDWLLSLGPELALRWDFGSALLRLGVRGTVSPSRPRLVVESDQGVATAEQALPLLSASATLGLQANLL